MTFRSVQIDEKHFRSNSFGFYEVTVYPKENVGTLLTHTIIKLPENPRLLSLGMNGARSEAE
jgi:hypothetical protein